MVTKEEKQMLRDLREAGVEPAETSMTRQSFKTAGKITQKAVLQNPLVTKDMSKRTKKAFKSQRPQRPQFDPTYSREQHLLHGMFGGNRLMTGGDFQKPHLQGVIRKGGGILKNGDQGRTGRMFGIR